MAKNLQCTEIQLTLHTIIVVIIGVLIGASLVSSADDIESELTDKIYSVKTEYDGIQKDHDFLIQKFKQNYEIYKALVYNGSEVGCKKVGNYAIDTSRSKEIMIDLVETFAEPPRIFVSINGFDFQPKLIKEDKKKETVDFLITEVNEKYFKVSIESDDPEFSLDDFNRLDVCYFAFNTVAKDYDPLEKSK